MMQQKKFQVKVTFKGGGEVICGAYKTKLGGACKVVSKIHKAKGSFEKFLDLGL